MKFVIYRRVSTKAQEESGLGLEAQQRDIDLFLSHYNKDGVVIKEFVEAKSGKGDLKDRPVLQEAVEFCEMNGYTLLVAKLDRLSRDVETVAHIIKRIDFKVAVMPMADKFQLHLYAAIAEQEREFISIRTKQALAVAKDKGTRLGCPKECEHKLGESQTKKSTEFKEKVQHHFIELIQLGKSLNEIANTLNERGVLTRLGKMWRHTSVHNFIKRFELREVAKNERLYLN